MILIIVVSMDAYLYIRNFKEHGKLSIEPQLDPNDPMYWQMWQDNWGGN